MQTVLWQADQNISSAALGMDPFSRTIPVSFAIPSDAYVTDYDTSSDQVLWLLHAQADVPGIDYSDDFELPVFKTSFSADQAPDDSSAETSGFAAGASGDSNAEPVAAPANPKVIVSSQDGGTEFYFPAFRTPSRALFLLIFSVIWTAVVYLLFHSKAPWFFPVIFGLMDLFVIFAVFHVALATALIRVGSGEIASTTRVLGIGSTNRFLFSEIDAVVAVTSGQQGGSQGNSMYAIRLRTRSGRRYTLADEISSRQEARWIVSPNRNSCWPEKSIPSVEIEFAITATAASQPPLLNPSQLGSLGPEGMRARWQQPARAQSRTSTITSIAVFLLFAGGMFAWQAWRFSTIKAAASASRANRARANAARLPVSGNAVSPRPAAFAHMTDSEAERVLALPAQESRQRILLE